jgi:signal transduction histidine kinase
VNADASELPLWRALAIYRLASLAYAIVRVGATFELFAHPYVAWVVVGAMGAWTAVTILSYGRRPVGWPLLVADLVVTCAGLMISPYVEGDAVEQPGVSNNLPIAWMASPVIAWAVSGGRRRGLVAALIVSGALIWSVGQRTADTPVLLVLAGIAIGHVARLSVEAQRRLRRAAELEAATRERERLARGIHDSVLQVLALVQRRGNAIGGEAAELGRLAGQQEAALRALVGSAAVDSTGQLDLRAVLTAMSGPAVSLATPAHPVPLPAAIAEEVGAAVAAALSNVRHHVGPDAPAWVLVEPHDAELVVTVRDDGPGIPAGRLEQAAADGRLGVAQSIRGRVGDLGGTVHITTAPGEGTEVELRIPLP